MMNSSMLTINMSNGVDPSGPSNRTSMKAMAPNHLPPKSPASIRGRKLLSSSSRSRGSSRRRSSSRRRGRSRSKSRTRRESKTSSDASCSSEYSSSSDNDSPNLLVNPPRIIDPSPIHLTVDTDTDDLSNAEHFSSLSFEKSIKINADLGLSESSSAEFSTQSISGRRGNGLRGRRRSHHQTQTWDSNTYTDFNPGAVGIGGRSCLAVPKILRRQRVMVADVASVGNASDTLVSIVETSNGKGRNRITGRELHETAKALMNEGDYEQALQMFEAILQAQLGRFGSEEHSSVGAALHNVGVVRLRIREPMKAEEAFLRALTIRRNVLGTDHLDIAATLAKLGSARTALGKFDEGLQDLREALKITRRVLGRNHRTVAQILCHIACLYFEAGEMFSAQSTFEDALEMYRGIFQIEDDRDACMAQLTETLCNIGSIQNKRKNFSGAIESFREALQLQRGIMGHDHPKVIATLDNLAYSFSKSKLYNQALTCYKEMLNAQVSHYGSFTRDCCSTLAKQVLIYGKLKKVDEAVQVVSKYLESIETNIGKEGGFRNDPVAEEVKQMLVDMKSAKKKSSKSKNRPRERSLDCFDRILFDKGKDRAKDTTAEF